MFWVKLIYAGPNGRKSKSGDLCHAWGRVTKSKWRDDKKILQIIEKWIKKLVIITEEENLGSNLQPLPFYVWINTNREQWKKLCDLSHKEYLRTRPVVIIIYYV